MGKRGPESFVERSKPLKSQGMKGRMVRRTLLKKGKNALQTYRSGWRRMWTFGEDRLRRWGIPEPDTWPEDNLMGGVMWATPQDLRRAPITGARCARVLELAWERGATVPILKLMRKSMSYLHLLATGIPKSNFPEVNAMFKSLDLKQCAASTPNLPIKILDPEAHKRASISVGGSRLTN